LSNLENRCKRLEEGQDKVERKQDFTGLSFQKSGKASEYNKG
jgi:hypothetical protein